MKVMGHKKKTVKTRETHSLMKIVGYKNSTVKSRATYKLRNQIKIMSYKKSV